MHLFKKKTGTEVSPATPGTSLEPRTRTPGFIRDFDSIFDDFRRSFDNLMRPYFPLDFPRDIPGWSIFQYAPLDVIDAGDHYQVHVELPGLSREDVEVNLNNESLSIKGQRKEESEQKEVNYLHRERMYSGFMRNITFPEEVDPDKAEGSMKNGILEMKIPKKEPRPEQRARKIEIK
ncbi:MAG TPA: Hsp20/alpha crystallin family protein [Methanoregulaceae archaeon]|nr:MAG: Small heat shock protein HSP16.5 [Methanoregulaceae archaeon PtaB.Bin152]OPY43757.1 MAG: Small heat shock protein HSP16.5 [Methanoregulaceae archaeon PtaU1.Bin059]HPD11502.1 Hsp20/alpha crystallin family protein [Methanoregulaceae archaeon]